MRSERASCEDLEYGLLFRWFLDMDWLECGFDATAFTGNRPRRRAHNARRVMFDEMVLAAHAGGCRWTRVSVWPPDRGCDLNQELPSQGKTTASSHK